MALSAVKSQDLRNTPSVSDVILKHLRDAIADGSLDEGEPIRQDDVARIFNVSKIPVREALKRLEAEGLVEFQRNRGAIVTSVSEPEIAQIFEVRAILESAAVRRAVPHMTEATFERAREACDAFAREADVRRRAEMNWRLHACLCEDAGRPFLVSTIRSINDRLERYLRIQLSLSHGQRTADAEHRQILAACMKGDGALAERLVYDHIMAACRSLLEHLPQSRGRP